MSIARFLPLPDAPSAGTRPRGPDAAEGFQPTLRFGRFEADLGAGTLSRDGTPVKLQPQPFKVLVLLAQRAGQVVTREEIRHEIWGADTFVNFDQGLAYCLNQIRGALGEQAQAAQYVQTLPRRGYRFVAPVSVTAAPAASGADPLPPRRGDAVHGWQEGACCRCWR